jgi:hypothetical protein
MKHTKSPFGRAPWAAPGVAPTGALPNDGFIYGFEARASIIALSGALSPGRSQKMWLRPAPHGGLAVLSVPRRARGATGRLEEARHRQAGGCTTGRWVVARHWRAARGATGRSEEVRRRRAGGGAAGRREERGTGKREEARWREEAQRRDRRELQPLGVNG